ncbi:hypothetical protein [Micrococcus terreus]|uniref:hypothetical protein n=1 Tax=Micrococcus terreus TaxID=574650 RepID=UPI00301B3F7C
MDELETDLDGVPLIVGQEHLEFVILADDPRFTPSHGIRVLTPTGDWSVDALERLAHELGAEYSWQSGIEENYRKTQGGIGADGFAVTSVILGVIGAIPTVEALLAKLNRRVPPRPHKDEALRAATGAIIGQYSNVARSDLAVIEESRESTHWHFVFASCSGDQFETKVFGDSAHGTSVQTLKWRNGRTAH